jgi:hypothetical protein
MEEQGGECMIGILVTVVSVLTSVKACWMSVQEKETVFPDLLILQAKNLKKNLNSVAVVRKRTYTDRATAACR